MDNEDSISLFFEKFKKCYIKRKKIYYYKKIYVRRKIMTSSSNAGSSY